MQDDFFLILTLIKISRIIDLSEIVGDDGCAVNDKDIEEIENELSNEAQEELQ